MILVFGINHRSAPVEIREKFSFVPEEIPEKMAALTDYGHIRESFILSTCNRVEIWAEVADLVQGIAEIKAFLEKHKGANETQLSGISYVLNGEAAVHHLFRVAASLDSMVVGEPQILGQLKEAFRLAVKDGYIGGALNPFVHRAFHVGKRVRTETEIARHPVSVSSVAVELATKIFADISQQVVMLVGAGEVMQETAERLAQCGVREILVANRTHEKAVELAERFRGTTFFMDRLSQHLPRADIVMICTHAPEPLITASMVRSVIETRTGSPIFLIDLSVPRNVEEEIARMENVYLYNIDDLAGIAQENLGRRKGELLRAEEIVREESRKFAERISADGFMPLIAALHQKAEEISQQELQRARKHFPDLTPKQEESLEAMSRAIAKKILHDPIHELKMWGESPENRHSIQDLIRRIFRLS